MLTGARDTARFAPAEERARTEGLKRGRSPLFSFMKQMFPEIEIEKNVKEPERRGVAHTGENRPWTAKDYEKLLLSVLEGEMGEEEIAKYVKRSPMSIIQKIGIVYPEYLRWEKKQKKERDTGTYVKKFVNEKYGD